MWNPRVTKITPLKVFSQRCRVLYAIGRIDQCPGERRRANRLSGETTAFPRLESKGPSRTCPWNWTMHGQLTIHVTCLLKAKSAHFETSQYRKDRRDLTYAYTREAYICWPVAWSRVWQTRLYHTWGKDSYDKVNNPQKTRDQNEERMRRLLENVAALNCVCLK